jgi:hypothetical protein
LAPLNGFAAAPTGAIKSTIRQLNAVKVAVMVVIAPMMLQVMVVMGETRTVLFQQQLFQVVVTHYCTHRSSHCSTHSRTHCCTQISFYCRPHCVDPSPYYPMLNTPKHPLLPRLKLSLPHPVPHTLPHPAPPSLSPLLKQSLKPLLKHSLP